MYGDASCLGVFGGSGGGPSPAWVAMPNQGFTPIATTRWTWTFQGNLGGISSADVTVEDVGTGQALPIEIRRLQPGFGQDAVSWVPMGWEAQAGSTYRVTIAGIDGAPVVYDVRPVDCG